MRPLRHGQRLSPGSPLGLLLLLLFLFLRALGLGRAAPRLLDHPAPVCAQQGLNCTVKNSTCLDDSWIHPRNLTPSAPKDLQTQLRFAQTPRGHLLPVVHIEWALQTDASILYLEGAELSVLQLSTNERLCVKFEFLSKLKHHHKRWRFAFSHFVVEPDQEYEVTVHHLPKPIPDGDPNHQSRNFLVPDCDDPRMKTTTPCVSSGSLWDPDITVETLEAHQLQLSFTPWNESTNYQILLSSFPHTENQSCFQYILDLPAASQEVSQRCCNITIPLLPSSWCCRHHVQIQPFFSSCLNDCLRHSVAVPCPKAPHTPDAVEGEPTPSQAVQLEPPGHVPQGHREAPPGLVWSQADRLHQEAARLVGSSPVLVPKRGWTVGGAPGPGSLASWPHHPPSSPRHRPHAPLGVRVHHRPRRPAGGFRHPADRLHDSAPTRVPLQKI